MKIGVFWVYFREANNHIIAKAVDLSQGEDSGAGFIDSPDNHIDVWENDPNWQNPFVELFGTEYQTIPRGRVLYSIKSQKAVVYMDRTLHLEAIKNLIIDCFQLSEFPISWRVDEHYTTEEQALDDIFDDELLY